MAKLPRLSWCFSIRRFPLLSNARLISCTTLRSREHPLSDGQHFPTPPKNSAVIYYMEKSRERAQFGGSDGSPVSMVQCLREWATLTENQKKPYIEQQRLQSQEYKKLMDSLSEEERSYLKARQKEQREHHMKFRQMRKEVAQWKKDRKEKAEVPKKYTGHQMFLKEKIPGLRRDHSKPSETLKAAVELWKDLPVDVKMRYNELARVQYENDMKAYCETHPNFITFMMKNKFPKRVSGYTLFVKERLQNVTFEDTGAVNQAFKAVSEEWNALSATEKLEYKERAKAQFEETMQKFRESYPGMSPVRDYIPRKKQGYSIFTKEALQRNPDANAEEVLAQWDQLTQRKKWHYKILAANQYNEKLKRYLED